ncbi:NAD(P)/FAD-dependent oxidoreductase [Streptococcus mutans]|jgi:Thioredoxin reductase|uniref:Ferredoxin--NADP reductase n=2 Tax=Streptococcus mutans serotype c (strain ATCC 700610 / UA159) TaxID=210007 RepID=FENR_STRMU|nr:NAD(P)/FAD-dependent oxidoreductase [Streptococcus mutans]Q8DUN5.1 RecName: Full=Ferredoxin--NADP reductase; Short=FNR; Short=Fd-NADP(+) reductase [Streptococcus mutans UA159]AAN58584.1 putative thioredoxin reductase [Streptococcus mutans UA159]AJD55230.1 thioredoxin reductase [Streptococcus mutans UA159-FR]EMB58889.1 thioredoxin reductase [Streptococcus mutans 8ID3]EMB69058.1 thioredoxin reductase [Streptococcus mutans 2ST1]EMB81151.1 thioredoxin reductase [Streptococcus mutans NFSM2]
MEEEKLTSEKEIYDITVIGGGPVGLFTAFYAGLRGISVKVIESLSELGGQPAILYPEKVIYDIPAFPAITGADLVDNLIEQLERFKDKTTICLKEEVKTFEKENAIFTITTNKGNHFSKAIIIACGNGAFAPRRLGLDDEERYADHNLFYNVHKLDQFAGKKVVICGGGDSAVDWANALDKIAESVTLVHRRDAFRAHEHSVEVLKTSHVNIMTPYVPLELKGEGDEATSLVIQKVKSEETKELSLDSLIVSFGFSTSNKNLKSWNIDYKRSSINVSPLFETSQTGVFAIGDAAEYEGKIDLIATGFGEAPTAVNQAIKYIYPERDNRVVHSTSLIK